jgi:hypothetical protein
VIAIRGEEEKAKVVRSVVCLADWPHGCWVLVVGAEGSEHQNWESEPRGWEDMIRNGEYREWEAQTFREVVWSSNHRGERDTLMSRSEFR